MWFVCCCFGLACVGGFRKKRRVNGRLSLFAVKSIQESLENKEEAKGIYGDLTRTAEPITIGSRHPISLVKNQIIDKISYLILILR